MCVWTPRGRRECFGADVQAAAALQTVNGLGGVHCSVLRPRAWCRSCDRHLVLRSTQRTVSASRYGPEKHHANSYAQIL